MDGWRSIEDDENDDDIRSSIFSNWDDSNRNRSISIGSNSSSSNTSRKEHEKFLISQLKLLNTSKIQQLNTTNSGDYVNEYYQEKKTNVIGNFFKGRDRIEGNQKSYFNQFDIIYEGYLYKKGTKYKLWEQSWKKRYFILRRDISCLTIYISKNDLTLVGSINISKDLKIGYDDNEDFTIFVQPPNEEKYFLRGESEMDINKWKMEIRILSKSDKIPRDWWNFLFNKPVKKDDTEVRLTRTSMKNNNEQYEDYTTALYDRKNYDGLFLPSVLREQNISNFVNFENNNSNYTAFIIAAKLCHLVNENDSVFAMVKSKFLNVTSTNDHPDNDKKYITCNVSCTELRIINKQVINETVYGIDTVKDCTIQFDLVQNFPITAIGADISIYKIEKSRDMNGKEHRKNIELCTVYISRNVISDIENTFTIPMKILEIPVMDLTNPIQVDSSAALGIIKIKSSQLYRHNLAFKKMFKIAPYSQMLYSFKTITGMTLTLEQIYASFYSVISSRSYCDLIMTERSKDLDYIIEYILSKLGEVEPCYKSLHLVYVNNGRNTRDLSAELSAKDIMNDINISQNLIKNIIEYKDKYISSVHSKKCLSENAIRLALESNSDTRLREGLDNILGYDVGGSVLKRSIWRCDDDVQFITNNLNIHIVSSVPYHYRDKGDDDTAYVNKVFSDNDSDETHIMPFITLGCPTAHAMKFKEGGLRSIFISKSSGLKNIYYWINLVQAVNVPNDLVNLLLKFPDQATHIFGSLDDLDNVQTVSKILMKRMAIAERLDVVTNQILGFAIASVKTVISLASKVGGIYSFILARSLKIGFLIALESLLSTSGKEMGMIQDLDIAVKWLKLLTIRLVIMPDCADDKYDAKQHSNKTFDGVVLRRDSITNRLIVDIFIDKQEAGTVISALKFMQDFNVDDINEKELDMNYLVMPALQFDYNPTCIYSDSENKPNVIAVCQLEGALFTQGINEMQTMVNLSRQDICHIQGEINSECIDSLKKYHSKYALALKYQLDKLLSQIDKDELQEKSSTPNKSRGKVNDEIFHRVLEDTRNQLIEAEQCVSKAISSPYEKHVDVLIKLCTLCSSMGSIVGLLCKSGKDRTSMAVTFEHAKGMVESMGVINGQRICSVLRSYGVRRMNVLANIGRPYFAFNVAQKNFLPSIYKPPSTTYKKGES